MKWWRAFGTWRITNVNSATDVELELAASACETLALLFGILVIAGLVVEVIEAIFQLDHCYSFFERWGAVVADVPVAVGVFGEIFFSRTGAASQSELQRRSKDRLAEIQKVTAWRLISLEQRERIRDLIGNKAATINVLIEYERGDPEAWSYARDISQVFQSIRPSKIRFGANQPLGLSVFGRIFEFAPGGKPIVTAFQDAGVDIAHVRDVYVPGPMFASVADPPNFHVFVCPKPPPALIVINDSVNAFQ